MIIQLNKHKNPRRKMQSTHSVFLWWTEGGGREREPGGCKNRFVQGTEVIFHLTC